MSQQSETNAQNHVHCTSGAKWIEQQVMSMVKKQN